MKRKILFVFILTFVVQELVAQSGQANINYSKTQWSEELSQKLSDRIKSYMQLTHTPGLAIAIIQNGVVVDRSFYGYADVGKQIPISEKSEFWLASISKHLTTAMVLSLEEDEILSRDDLLIDFLHNLPEPWSNIKVKHLMSHTSGIVDKHNAEDGNDFVALLNSYAPGSPTVDEFVTLLKNVEINKEPGKEYNYSDIGMMVLAVAASKAAGKNFNLLMQERIFEHSKMSAYINNPAESHPKQVIGYTWTNWQLQEDENRKSALSTDQRKYGGAGSLFVTLDDMINWNHALNENHILSQETKELLWNNYQLSSGEEIAGGLGLKKVNYPGGYAIGHNGIAGTEYWKFPENNIDIIILTNHGMNLASFGFAALVAESIGLLNDIKPEILINQIQARKATLNTNRFLSGKYKVQGPFPTEVFIEFYIENQVPYAMIQGLSYELIPLENNRYLGYSKAIFFPGAPLPYFEMDQDNINWMMGPKKLSLTKMNK